MTTGGGELRPYDNVAVGADLRFEISKWVKGGGEGVSRLRRLRFPFWIFPSPYGLG
jgi:hypothetical protein